MHYASPDTGISAGMHPRADLATLRTVPWEEGTALCLMDAYVDPGGSPHPLDARSILRSAGHEPVRCRISGACGLGT